MDVCSKVKNKSEDKYFLYKIYRRETPEKTYVGVSSDPNRRWRQHIASRENCPKLHRAIKKHGKESFVMETLCCGSVGYILDLEKKYIEATNSIKSGYNCHEGGVGGKVSKRKDDTPIYVSGFWFPSPRVAMTSLQMTRRVFSTRKRSGVLGSCENNGVRVDDRHPIARKIMVHGKVYNSINGAARLTQIPVYKLNCLLRKDNSGVSYV